jgi:hypothetical protein
MLGWGETSRSNGLLWRRNRHRRFVPSGNKRACLWMWRSHEHLREADFVPHYDEAIHCRFRKNRNFATEQLDLLPRQLSGTQSCH